MNKVLYIILISLFSLILTSCADKEEEKEGPVLTEVYPVTTPTDDPSPNYTFSSTKAGTITYGGSCSSVTTSAISGNNTITFTSLSDGTYSDCTIIVKDSVGNASNTLAITSFVVIPSYVAVGDSGTFLKSTDGTTWTKVTTLDGDNNSSSFTKTFNGVAYGDSKFVTVGSSGKIYTSDNGTTWTSRTSGTSNTLNGVSYIE